MKKSKNMFKYIVILAIILIVAFICIFIFRGGLNREEAITDLNKYQEVIGVKANNKYKDKWGMSEEIFPKSVKDLDVKDFKMVYLDAWDNQYLSYLVVDYSKDEYENEVERLNKYGIEDYIGYYGVTGFTNYKLLAMESDSYQGFVYAITDNRRIIYVEMIFCNYFMDIKYNEHIPNEYLPDNFDATINNSYRKKFIK